MDRISDYYRNLSVSSLTKRWNFVPKVYAQENDTKSIFDKTLDKIKAKKQEMDDQNNIKKNSDEFYKTKLEDPVIRELVEKDIERYISKETGLERITQMYFNEDHRSPGESSPQIKFATSVSLGTFTIVFLMGGMMGANAACQKFIDKNQHTVFETNFMAKRKFNDTMMFGSMRFGLKLGLKALFLTGTFLLASQTISTYRNKSSIIDYSVGGGIAGSVMRFTQGWRGMVVGGIIGSAMGLCGGIATIGMMKIGKMTQEQRHHQELLHRFVDLREFGDRRNVSFAVETVNNSDKEESIV